MKVTQEQIDIFEAYQNPGPEVPFYQRFHPLTCGNNSNHALLKLSPDGYLFCPDCNYTQNWMPTIPDTRNEKEQAL